MPLRFRVKSNPETVQDFALASDEKYWEGISLLVSGRRSAGIYLLGYAAEMILKNACFLTEGARPFDYVGARLAPIRSWARKNLPGVPDESYHSLWFWGRVLRKKRMLLGRPLSRRLDSSLAQRTHRLYGLWIVDMRYKPDEALEREAESVHEDVTWLRDRRLQLVR